MVMAGPATVSFAADLADLWASADENTTIYDTADLIETFWSNSMVAAMTSIVVSQSTYAGFTPMAVQPPVGTPASAAASFELAISTMVLGTTFIPVPPSVTVPPPVPVPAGPATPGILTTSLTGIFTAGALAPTPTAPLVSAAIIAYLAAWLIGVVTSPSPTVVPTPIT